MAKGHWGEGTFQHGSWEVHQRSGVFITRWSRQEAIEYMLNHTFITHKEASKEIDRYITWPGQACAYKVGEMKIKELRQVAEQRLGE